MIWQHYWKLLVVLFLFSAGRPLGAEEIVSSRCLDFSLSDIPVGDFSAMTMPMEEMRITQEYNTSYQEGWCEDGGSQPPANSPACQGAQIYYGHDGLDLHPFGAVAGDHEVWSIQNGLVIASENGTSTKGWGESVIVATRPNAYSEEVITFHYHHLDFDRNAQQTSRRFNACDLVSAGETLGLEGGTPDWPTHLHLSAKRWQNATELLNTLKIYAASVYGSGYVFGNSAQLVRHLDPAGLLFDYFTEFEDAGPAYPNWQWSEPYALEVRRQGWHFGEYDGRFGVDTVLQRREAARLVKVASQTATVPLGAVDYFYDLPPYDPDYPYINTLCQRPALLPAINVNNSCTDSGHNFCPDSNVTRAEAIKMIVAAFFSTDFLEFYNNWVWRVAAPLASNTLSRFTDISPYAWYAPYVYLAWQKGLVTENSNRKFYPHQPLRRAEMAKWLVLAHQQTFPGQSDTICETLGCAGGYYCDRPSQSCQPIPACVPQDGEQCPLGGGYILPDPTANADAGTISVDGGGGVGGGAAGTDTGTSDGGAEPGDCVVSYLASPPGDSCHLNSQSSGAPTLCLELDASGGPVASWRLCKEGTAFQNIFSYQLLDQNHLPHAFGGPYSGSSGQNCTSWRTVDFGYLVQNGPLDAAGLIVEVHSPTGCTSQACTYYSGITTVSRQCE